MDKRQIVDVLEDIALLMELAGENPFKCRAYANAARAIQTLDRDLVEVVERGELKTIRGIGAGLAENIAVLVRTGALPLHAELRAQIPPGLLDMMRIPGLGPKRAKEIHAKLGIASIGELEYAAQSAALQELPGFGVKLQQKILDGIAAVKRHSGRYLLSDVQPQGERLLEAVRALPQVTRAQLAGSLRRWRETVKDVDLVAATDDPEAVMAAFVELEGVEAVVARGDTKTSVQVAGGIQVDLRAVTDDEFPYTLHHFTGSKEHNVAMRARAQERGLKINEYGLWKGDERVPCRDETEFFAALGLAFIAPELREDQGEIEVAERGELPRLVECGDLKGVLHTHSTYSDGIASIREMALGARERGYGYIGLTDHSQSARYANGMQPADVERYLTEIDALNRELEGIVILKGTECDILADGSLDYPDDILSLFDFVVGSVHSRFGMPEAEMTARIVRALENPYLDILGHATGRLLLSREPYLVNLTRVLERAAELGVVVEINANPHRLDLDWRECKGFLERGGWVSINPDAHRVEGLDDVRFGVAIARKGWVTADRVLNALELDELRRRLGARRGQGVTR